MGSIMFMCGLNTVSLKIVGHLQPVTLDLTKHQHLGNLPSYISGTLGKL